MASLGHQEESGVFPLCPLSHVLPGLASLPRDPVFLFCIFLPCQVLPKPFDKPRNHPILVLQAWSTRCSLALDLTISPPTVV